MGFLKKFVGGLGPIGLGALGALAAPFTFGTSLAGVTGLSAAAQVGMGAAGYAAGKGAQSSLANEATDKARADAEAAAKQAAFEATQREGLERLALRRKRGFGASMIVDPTLGATTTLGS